MSDPNTLCMSCMTHNLTNGVCGYCNSAEAYLWTAPHHLRPRTILYGKYLVGKVIGEGGFGITYVGWDLSLSAKVAVKEYYPNGFVSRDATLSSNVYSFGGGKGEFYERGRGHFIEEAQRLAKFYMLPGIVSVKDFLTENGTAYIVMEFVEGATLKTVLGNMGGRMPEAHVLELMRPIISSLAQIHKAGVIHRDIAPDNIMLQPNGSVKLLDFGAARDASTDGKSTAAIMKHGYAPEEQYDPNRTRQGPWTDVYAVCATIYRAIEGSTPPDAISRLRTDSFTGFTVPVSENTRRVLMKGLALLPKNRWQDFEELSRKLYSEVKRPAQEKAAFSAQTFKESKPPAAKIGGNYSKNGLKTCEWCKKSINADWTSCPHCGSRTFSNSEPSAEPPDKPTVAQNGGDYIKTNRKICERCGKNINADWTSCPHCGNKTFYQ